MTKQVAINRLLVLRAASVAVSRSVSQKSSFMLVGVGNEI